jgi:hypothetical protein
MSFSDRHLSRPLPVPFPSFSGRHLFLGQNQSVMTLFLAPVRISFIGTLKLIGCRLGEAGDTPTQQRRWWEGLVEEVAVEEVIEARRPRVNPRVLKRTTFDFPKKKQCHRGPRPDAPTFRKVFRLLH